jgi:hypothetical protein
MNIEAQIYMNKLLEVLYEENHFQSIASEHELDESVYTENLKLELETIILDNINKFEQPMLSEDQMRNVIMTSITHTILDSLMSKGIIESEFDTEEGELVYRLTSDGEDHLDKLSIGN